MTRAVFFDVDGVLVHGYHARPDLTRRWNENLLADLGVDPDRFNAEFIFDIFIKKVVVGEMAILDALERRLPGLGYKGSSMRFLHYWLSHDSTLNTDLIETVRKLKARDDLRLYIATNQDHSRAQWLWQTLGLGELFDDIFYSARAGVRKPEKGFFDFIEQRIGPQTEPPLFFDDTPKVIEGARKYGWEAVQFDTIDDCTNHPWIADRI
ncbi:MAG TPA: HAD-IA family hydrolase [Devosia sp.]|nr:HAD-IA family hydrolase [Devosia sp.]